MKLRLSYPNSLPIIGGIAGSLMSVSYYLGIMFSQLFVGRPPSTWILGFFWLPVFIFKPALIGLLIGSATWLMFRPFNSPRPLSPTEAKILKMFLIFLISTSALAGIIKIVKEASHYAPHIVYTSDEITKTNGIPFQSYNLANAVQTWETRAFEESLSTPISWNGETITVYSVDDSMVIANQNQIVKRMKLGNDDIRYMPDVYAIPVRFNKNKPDYLAVLVEARAIRDCYILLIFNAQGQLSFQEILKETKRTSNPMQKITNTADGQEALIVDVDSLIVYKGVQ